MIQFKNGKDVANVNLECVDYIINCGNGDYKFRFGSGRNATYPESVVVENDATKGFRQVGNHFFRESSIVRIDVTPAGAETIILDWGTCINGASISSVVSGFIVINNADGGKTLINPTKVETIVKLFLTVNVPVTTGSGEIAFNANVAEEFLTAVSVTLTDGTPFKLSGKEAIQILAFIQPKETKVVEEEVAKRKGKVV